MNKAIEIKLEEVRGFLDKAANSADQSTKNSSLMMAVAYLVDVVEKQQEQIENLRERVEHPYR